MSQLADRTCVPCKGGEEPLTEAGISALRGHLSGEWKVIDEHHLVRAFSFPDFMSALAFTNQIGEIAENEGHHPDILLAWGKVEVKIWTHAIDGLSENDFVLAAKIDRLREGES